MKTNGEILHELLKLVDNGQQDTQQGGAAVLGHCGQCGQQLKRKSRNGRIPKFCNSQCRVANWRAKQREEKTNGR